MFLTNLIIFFKLISCVTAVSILPNSRSLKFDRLDGMSRGRNVPIRSQLTITKQDKYVIYVKIVTNVSEDITGDPLMYITVNRCRTKENLDSCEEYIKGKPISYCNTLDMPGGAYNPLYVEFTPKFGCPLKKGSYQASNTTLDLAPLMVFPLGGWYWKTLVEVKDLVSERLLYCIYAWWRLAKDQA